MLTAVKDAFGAASAVLRIPDCRSAPCHLEGVAPGNGAIDFIVQETDIHGGHEPHTTFREPGSAGRGRSDGQD